MITKLFFSFVPFFFLVVIIWFLFYLCQTELSTEQIKKVPLVKIPNGEILGYEDSTAANKSFYGFEKIPYAKPPVGDLRFKAPQPVDNWNGVLNASHLDVICYQLAILGKIESTGTESEDCLYLNVYTPKLTSDKNDELLAVIFYINGGAFVRGSATRIDHSPDMFINNELVVVTVNFRLGIFGFASTQDELIPGNYGLKDQAMALRWVHDNIKFFGGDPERVTIVGNSSGGSSCAYQILNLNNLGIFSGVILQSGTSLCPFAFQRNPRKVLFGIGAILNSSFGANNDTEALIELLLNTDAEELNEAALSYANGLRTDGDTVILDTRIFAPVIELETSEAFLTEKMYTLLKGGNVVAVPTMMGITSEENIAAFQRDRDVVRKMAENLDDNLDMLPPIDMRISDRSNRTKMGRLIREIYTGGEAFADHIEDTIRFSSDFFMNKPMIKYAELISKIAKTYFYQFSFSGQLNHMEVQYEGAKNVGHAGELRYLFCGGTNCTTEPETDLLTRQRLATLWANFAKYRNPTPEASELLLNVTWPQVLTDKGDFVYLDIGENLVVNNHPKQETYAKWVELYDSLGYDDFDTY